MLKNVLKVEDLSVYYGEKQALFDVNLKIQKHEVLSLIGPSGCGKSTFIRCLNRINDIIPSCSIDGKVMFHGKNIYDRDVEPVVLRQSIGMVFQKPNPFPKSIYDNVLYGVRIKAGKISKTESDSIVESSLKRAGLWKEVKDRLTASGLSLSGGQQQRLCIARAIATNPEVLLMDEPCSALDPIATRAIEDLIEEIKEKYTIVIVTHSMAQARRVSSNTAFFNMGKIIESGSTKDIFENPEEKETRRYIEGKIG
jgi:phosphate transport system ATP-binding protein